MIKFNKLLYAGFFVVLFSAIVQFFYFFTLKSFTLESSVWCFRGSNQSNICKFKNICYDLQFRTFLFFLGKGTVIKGFNHYSELQKIQLSSVQPHNQFYANLSVINSKNYKATKNLKIHSKILLFGRFKPNNIMHTVHDDLFPVFLTLESVCSGDIECMESYSLMFHDDLPKGPFFKLYELFSKNSPIVPKELNSDPNYILCFEEMLTGLILDGIFYQYGFKRPHGPIRPTQLNQYDISRFTSYVKNKLQIQERNTGSEIILFGREKNRKILNIIQVKEMIENAHAKLNEKVRVKLINLDLFSNDLTALIHTISESDGLIGMHGAEMILSLFMKPGSYVCELFPFGINPNVVSYIKPISELEGSHFKYISWKNQLRNNSLAHPDAHPLFGGVSHLDKNTQEYIKSVKEVPAVECCHNPLFLYHMYQDTWVSSEFGDFLYESLSRTIHPKPLDMTRKWFHPYKVVGTTCKFISQKKVLQLNWNPPFNTESEDLKYSLYIRDQKGLFSKEMSTENATLKIELPADVSPELEVWISAIYVENHSKGPDVYLKCLLTL